MLVNLGNADRGKIGKALSAISPCNPKVIGIDLVFKDSRYNKADSILFNAIQQADNVILPQNLEDGEIISSSPYFASVCKAQGLLNFGYTQEQVTKHKIYFSYADQLVWSFPVTIASYYDVENSDKIMKSVLANEYYEISYKWKAENFEVIDVDSLDFECPKIKDKIVLMGNLGPGSEDLFDTPNGKIYGTIIVANFVENLLEEQFEKTE